MYEQLTIFQPFQRCAYCGKEYPATTQFFYYRAESQKLRSQCKRCTTTAKDGLQCSVEGCEDPARTLLRGYCDKHYARWRRYGDPLGGATFRRKHEGYCLQCGKPSETAFCSSLCRHRSAHHRPSGERSCKWCGSAIPSEEYLQKVCCSKQCRVMCARARQYGLTVEEFKRLVQQHGDRCAICGARAKLHVDHDHASSEVRGLLCRFCNQGLGFFRDNPDLLGAAVHYLKGQTT